MLRKDIPIVRSLLGVPFTAVAFKGRGTYLCSTRLRNAVRQQRRLFDKDEFADLERIRDWARVTSGGNIDDIPFTPLSTVWQQVRSEKGVCSRRICGADCFFQKAREDARLADLVIMNHALFFTLFALQDAEEFFVFRNDFVIFDEAHVLEQVAGLGAGKSISRSQALFAIHRLYNPATRKGLLSQSRMKRYQGLCVEAERAVVSFFGEVGQTVRGLSDRSTTLRVRSHYFVNDTVSPFLRGLQSEVNALLEKEKPGSLREELDAANRLVRDAESLIREFLEQPDEGATYWVDSGSGRSPNAVLNIAPTSVAESVGKKLFREGTTVILTSGTLSVNGSLSHVQTRLGAGHSRTQILDSPFDFRKQMRITLVRDIPAPDQEGYERALPEVLWGALVRSKGKALVLFTSGSLLRDVAATLRDTCEEEGITLLVQDGSVGRHQLLERFKADIRSVLFGLDSFWMGVDVPGEALEHVVITRLPFAVPDHPLTESRLELIAKSGGNAFQEYTLPEAILKFRQGVGRLIRSKTDRGMVTVLDSRIITRSYGRLFLESLPPCPVEVLHADGSVVEVEGR
jgi:ATP-dependent DNA helicase DinG